MKRLVLTTLVFILVAGIGAAILYFGKTSPETASNTKKDKIELPHGKQTYLIQSASAETAPSIYEATVDPVDVHPGDTQKMEVKVRGEKEIVEVKAEVETDNGTKTYNLKLITNNLITDNSSDGIWQGEWVVQDTHDETYHTTFTAKDAEGKTASVTITWTDPCTPPIGGPWTLAGACNTGANTTTGAAGGGITLGNYDITIDAGGKVVWADGSAITINGTGKIIVNTTGVLVQQKVWMLDADGDGYPADTTQVGSATSPGTGYRERQLLSGYTSPNVDQNDGSVACAPTCGPTTVTAYFDKDLDGYTNIFLETLDVNLSHREISGEDCYDNNAQAYFGQVAYFSAPRGDGSFDYNCDNQISFNYPYNVATLSPASCTTSRPSGVGGWIGSALTNADCGQRRYLRACRNWGNATCSGGASYSPTFDCQSLGVVAWSVEDSIYSVEVGCR